MVWFILPFGNSSDYNLTTINFDRNKVRSFASGLTTKNGLAEQAYVDALLQKLTDLGCKNVIFTGISYEPGKTGVVVFENGVYSYYEHEKLPNSCHGTGDIYASAFVGALVRGKPTFQAAQVAADYTLECIRFTATLDNHWYGAAFEPVLPKLIQALN